MNSYVSSHIDLPLFVRWFYPSLGYVLLLWYVCKDLSKSNDYFSAETWLSCHDNFSCQFSQCDAIGRNNRCLVFHSVEFPIHVRLINNTLWSPRQKCCLCSSSTLIPIVQYHLCYFNKFLHSVSLGGCWGHRGGYDNRPGPKKQILNNSPDIQYLVHSQQHLPDRGLLDTVRRGRGLTAASGGNK